MLKYIKTNWHLLLVGLGLTFYAAQSAWKPNQSDFNVPLHASGKLLEGLDLYEKPFMDGSQYYYSPFYALVLSPFAIVHDYQDLVYRNENIPTITEKLNYVEFLWLILNIFFLYRIWCIVRKVFPLEPPKWSRKSVLWLFFLTVIFISRPLDFNFRQVQMTIFLVWCSLEGIFMILDGKKVGGAAILALGINIKIMPILLIFYLLYRKEFRAVLYVFVISLILLYLPALFIGWEYNQQLLVHWFEIMNPVGKVNITPDKPENYYGFHSIAALVNSLFTNNELEIRTHIVDIGYDKAVYIAHGLRLLLAAGTLWFLRTLPFRKAASMQQNFFELSYILAVTPLLFPHQQKYSFFYLLPAGFYLLWFLLHHRKAGFEMITKKRWRVILILLVATFALTTLTSDLFGGLKYGYITQYLKLMTWGALLLLVPLALARPTTDNTSGLTANAL